MSTNLMMNLPFKFVSIILSVLLIFFSAPPKGTYAGAIIVDTLLDESDGSCSDGDCSLRDAIQVAAPGDTITFSVTGTLVLNLGKLNINKDLTINGPGSDSLVVDGNQTFCVFFVTGENTAFSGLTIANGSAIYGGGVYNTGGSTSLADVAFNNNFAISDGGGLFNGGTATLTNVTFTGNSARWGGGGMENEGSATLTDVTFSGNTANTGGGLYNSGTATLTDVTFSANSTTIAGGGMDNSGTATLTGVTFSDNLASNVGGGMRNGGTSILTNVIFSNNSVDDSGGGMFNNGPLTLTNAIFSNNSTLYYYGGGLYNYDGTTIIMLTNVSFSNNSAAYGGGMRNDGSCALVNVTFSANIAYDNGGGMSNHGIASLSDVNFNSNSAVHSGGGMNNDMDGTASLTGITFSGNSSENGGGMYNNGTYTMVNATFSGNFAFTNGGGIKSGGPGTLTNVTLSSNTASGQGGGIDGNPGLKNTLLAGNTAPTGPDCSGTLTSYGYNLIQDTTGCTIAGDETGNIYGEDPLLGPLADNGGYTLTHALLPGSPAIDGADFTDPSKNPILQDQRGVSRPQGPANDIGAFEVVKLWLSLIMNTNSPLP